MIAFDSACDIYLMRADGSDVRALTDNSEQVCNGRPSFTPDGREIAFTSRQFAFTSDRCNGDDAVQPQICVIRTDGTGLRPLTGSGHFGALDFSLSPNGKRIAFDSVDSLEDTYGLWVMRANGTKERELVSGDDPDWGVRR